MDQNITPKSLYDPLRSRINRYAHLQGQQHENVLRAAMTAQVQQARDAGVGYEALAELVRGFEAGNELQSRNVCQHTDAGSTDEYSPK
jgi:hypothetical protein